MATRTLGGTPSATARTHRQHAAAIRKQARAAAVRVRAVRAVAQANRREARSALTPTAARARELEAVLADQLGDVVEREMATLQAEAARADSAALAAQARAGARAGMERVARQRARRGG